MSQNISLWGASYSSVPSVTLPKTGGGTASFTDVTDTTATASDVASGKYFYTAAGVKTQGTSTSGGYITQDSDGYVVLSSTNGVPTLKTKSITANGTYNASSDNATGYSSVTVNVQSSGANIETLTISNAWSTVSFTLKGEPKAFFLQLIPESYGYNIEQSGYYRIVCVSYDGTNTTALYGQSGNLFNYLGCTFSYSGSTLTISDTQATNSIYGSFQLTYIY